jgi:hypothetical protein
MLINHKQRNNKLQENLKILHKLMLVYLIKKKEKDMIWVEWISKGKALIWVMVQLFITWAEVMVKLISSLLLVVRISILTKFLRCFSIKMVVWVASIPDSVDLVLVEKVEIVVDMGHKVMVILMILEISQQVALILEALVIMEEEEVNLDHLAINLGILVPILEELINKIAATTTKIKINDFIFFQY